MIGEEKYWYLEGKNPGYIVPKEELIDYLCIFQSDSVLQFVSIDELRKCAKNKKERDRVKPASKPELIEILLGFKAKEIYDTLKLDEVRQVDKQLLENALEKQCRDTEAERKATKESLSIDKGENQQNQVTNLENKETEIKTEIDKKTSLDTDVDEMTNNDDVKLQIFDGRNYSIWKNLLLFLKWKKCDEPATRERLSSEEQVVWNEKDEENK